jgi:hypothetical protein
MLFDLQGKRRRVVQATYLVLAILMGGGLVLFGIGSGDISGGLFDAITGKSSNGGNGNSIVAKRIASDEKALKLNPNNTAALQDLVRSHYQLATDDADRTTGQFGPAGKAQLAKAAEAWQRYQEKAKTVDPSMAALMVNAFSEIGLNQPANAARAAQLVAEAQPSAAAYLQLMRFAQAAKQTRLASLAADKAISLAPSGQKKLVEQQVAAIKNGGASANAAPTVTSTPKTNTSKTTTTKR